MSSRVHKKFSFFFFIGVTLLAGCEINKKRSPEEVKEDSRVFPFFTYVHYGVANWPQLQQISSGFSGYAAVTTPDSSLEPLYNPPLGSCFFNGEQPSIQFSPIRYLNIGDLLLRGEGLQDQKLTNSGQPYYKFGVGGLTLGYGKTFSIQPQGVNGRLSWTQPFQVPGLASNITFRRGDNTEFMSPSPVVRQELGKNKWDVPPEDVATIKKDQDLFIEYTAPAGTTFVELTIADGSDTPLGQVSCYGSTEGPIWIPAGKLINFQETAEGFMFLDFVNVSLKTDIDRIHESLVISKTRHIHGRKIFQFDEQTQQAFYFGVLKFE